MSSTIHPLPSFGLGTFRLTGQVVVDSVRSALELGYRAIDTAQIYGNEADIGRAIAESGVPRSELFLTTKIWVDNYASDKLVASLREPGKAPHRLRRPDPDPLAGTRQRRRAGGVHGGAGGSQVPGPDPADRRLQLQHRADPPGHRRGRCRRDRHQPDRTQPLPAEPGADRLPQGAGHPGHLLHDPGLRQSPERTRCWPRSPPGTRPASPRSRWPGPCNWATR